jgi:cysteine desulfurase
MDANAGVPLLPEAREAMLAALGSAANASSVHAEGRAARGLVETARAEVAALAGVSSERVVFTSGATEAATLALSPRVVVAGESVRIGRLYVGATEHPSVLAGGRFPAAAVTTVPVLRSGAVDLAALAALLDRHDDAAGPPLVALMLANNETGVIHPVAEAAALVKARGGFLFCDAVQAPGRLQVGIRSIGADFLAVSAHKMGGPQGAGALILADGDVHPEPLLRGGGQERHRRAGTENVAALAAFGVAARLAGYHLDEVGRLAGVRSRLEEGIRSVAPAARIFGVDAERIANTTLFAVPGLAAEVAVIAFDLAGISLSAGSACSSGKVAASHVLRAMGEAGDAVQGAIRVSLTPNAEAADVDTFLAAWGDIYERLRESRAA